MENTFLGILLGLLTNLVASAIFEGLRSKVPYFPGPPSSAVIVEPTTQAFNSRARNREKADYFFINVRFYFCTLLVLYLSVCLPPVFKARFFSGGESVFLDDARIVGWLLPNWLVTDYFQFELAAITLVLYLPVLYIASLLAIPVANVANNFFEVNLRNWRKIQSIVFSILAVLIAGLSVYAFSNYDLKIAMLVPVFFIVLVSIVVYAMVADNKK